MKRFCLLAAMAAFPAALTAQSGAFLVRLGVDTLGIERYTRTATELKGDQVLRSPRGVHRIFTVTYRADGSVERYELVTHNVDGGPGPAETRATAEFHPARVAMRVPRGDSMAGVTASVPARIAPFGINMYALAEDVLRRARASGQDVFRMPIVSLGNTDPDTATVTRHGPDSVIASFGGIGPFRIRTDAEGSILGLSGIGGTLNVTVERVDATGLADVARSLGSRPLGALSPADSVKVRVGRADLSVHYARPTMRGRKIFGGVVPFDRVWRTGANTATLFKTSRDLEIGGAQVPAGSYTLYSIPAAGGFTLIINKNTGQWGTNYDQTHDLVRVPMRVATLKQPVEQFTIAIDRRGGTGELSLVWERTRASVPIRVK